MNKYFKVPKDTMKNYPGYTLYIEMRRKIPNLSN